jgi:hypothetical protein
MTGTVETATEIRPFHIDIPQEEIDELRRRVSTTRWPTRELVDDRSQGVQLAATKDLARYWTTEYDWRRCEARLNALPQFKTKVREISSGSTNDNRNDERLGSGATGRRNPEM